MSLGHLHRFDPLLGDLFWVQTKVGIVYLDTTLFSFLFVIDEVDWFTLQICNASFQEIQVVKQQQKYFVRTIWMSIRSNNVQLVDYNLKRGSFCRELVASFFSRKN